MLKMLLKYISNSIAQWLECVVQMILAPGYLLSLLFQDPTPALLQTHCEYLKRMCAHLLVGAV